MLLLAFVLMVTFLGTAVIALADGEPTMTATASPETVAPGDEVEITYTFTNLPSNVSMIRNFHKAPSNGFTFVSAESLTEGVTAPKK